MAKLGKFLKINGKDMPYPKRGLDLVISTFVDAGRNANGEIIGEVIGRDQFKVNNLEWLALTQEEVTYILKELRDFYFDATMINPYTGNFMTLKMYRGDITTRPYFLDEDTDQVTMYSSLKVNIIDVGVQDGIVEEGD